MVFTKCGNEAECKDLVNMICHMRAMMPDKPCLLAPVEGRKFYI